MGSHHVVVSLSWSHLTMLLLTALLALSLHTAWAGPRIVNLRGRPEYKKVSLSWGVDSGGQAPSGLFRLRFCENQIWGEHYCQERLLEDSQNKQNFSTDIYGLDGHKLHVLLRNGNQPAKHPTAAEDKESHLPGDQRLHCQGHRLWEGRDGGSGGDWTTLPGKDLS